MAERVSPVGGRRARRLAIIRKISLPESAHECAASATSDADPVSTAAADFATAIRTLAVKATSTVVTLSDVLEPRSNGTDMNGSRDPRAVPSVATGTGACSPPCSRAINHS
jgi:hypothetical protein